MSLSPRGSPQARGGQPVLGDLGTPASYATSVLDALRENGETVYLSPEARCGKIGMDGYVVLEGGSEVLDKARLRNCIVLPGASVSGKHDNRIIGPDYAVELGDTEMQPSLHAREQKKVALSDPLFIAFFGMAGLPERSEEEVQADAILIGLGGSDRRYYRVRNDGKTAVLMECRQEDPDYERHLLYTRFFEAHSVPVPGILETDEACRCALFEDLGDTSLYSYLKLPRDTEHIEDIYQSVLDILVKMHSRITRHIDECPPLKTRVFDYDHLRWETAYFLERFVVGLKETAHPDKAALEDEFHRLAQKVDGYHKVAIHRDFQCQNIMITPGGIPRVIDFQGARMAPPAYDVASILWDPYYRLDEGIRERLIDYYVDEMRQASVGFNDELFRKSLVPCRLQRHMQALGAYGFLSVVKGKKYFLKHVPEALRLLKEKLDGGVGLPPGRVERSGHRQYRSDLHSLLRLRGRNDSKCDGEAGIA